MKNEIRDTSKVKAKKRRGKWTGNIMQTTFGGTRALESGKQATLLISDRAFQAGNRPVSET